MHTIILLGPHRAGKSTTGRLIAASTGRAFHTLPAFDLNYFGAAGATQQGLESAWGRGFEAWYHYLQPFLPEAVRRFVHEHEGDVLELDAALLILDDPQVRAEVQALLAPYKTALLLPSGDVSSSVRALHDRQRILYNGVDLNYYFVMHPANRALAKHTIYTKDRSPDETADEVVAVCEPGSPIILIGPMNVGKSTIAQQIAARQGMPRASLDEHRWRYYAERGFTREEMQRIDDAEGPQGVIAYWKRFDVHAVERFLQEFTDGVLDFGAGHSIYDDPDDLLAVRARLVAFPNVVLLMPSPDPDESYDILRKRSQFSVGGVEVTEYLLTSPVLYDLAKIIVTTDDSTPEETSLEIMERFEIRRGGAEPASS